MRIQYVTTNGLDKETVIHQTNLMNMFQKDVY